MTRKCTPKRILSVILTLSLLAGSLLCFSFGAGAVYYSEGQKIARVIADEGIVLLKNENDALPVNRGGSVALFGEAQRIGLKDEEFWNKRGYIPYGYGSESQAGDFGDKPIDPLDALEAAEKNGEISLYHEMSALYTAALSQGETFIPTDAQVREAARSAQTAICFFSRWGGEAFDVSRADWYLRDSEKALLRQLTTAFRKVVVVLNTPSVIDTSWANGADDDIRVDAVLYVGYTGMQGGLGIADVLLGRVNPSGKTNDTWAKDLTDYPSDAQNNTIRWNIDLTDRFGVEQYPFGTDATLSLLCGERSSTADEPQVEIRSNRPVTVELYWDEGRQSRTITVDGSD